jgi:D-lyxose ketol-isomerase
MKEKTMDRRSVLKAAGSLAGLGVAGVALSAERRAKRVVVKPTLQFQNAEFYGADGKLDVEKAKDGILRLCRHHGYPVFPDFRQKLFVSDYGIGQFTQLGLAGVMFQNNVEDRYMLMDLFLLPGQMLPEHWHEEAGGNPAKREGWLVRWGVSHIVGIGTPNLGKDVVVPKCHWGGKVTVEHEVVARPGMFVPLAKVASRHWQYAGPEGAIVTEVANVHTDAGVRHTDPVLNAYFLKGAK